MASSHIIIVRHNRDIKLSRSADCMFSFIGTSITVCRVFGNLAKRGHDPGIGEDDIELAAVFFDLRKNAIELRASSFELRLLRLLRFYRCL